MALLACGLVVATRMQKQKLIRGEGEARRKLEISCDASRSSTAHFKEATVTSHRRQSGVHW